ncbi:oxidoreductase [Actinophytocola xinjiangensis]|uniref:Oxidoreductase n=1 Tax=Actinophytocola xinjiangensis TaxID=485602 RepID=A0A7Z1AXL7_9PSEU|nr:oxidoreductase [Actinophytocola xinjiangensis]OLF07852.1 oxidoreductase [Actinophytocola xinjiangensis]
MTDPLAPLLELPGVRDAVAAAREAVDQVHGHQANRRGWPTTAAEASVRAARASAALDGAEVEIPESGEVNEPVLAGALRIAESIGPMLPTWQRAPMQALAKLHVLAATDLLADDALGRPRPGRGMSRRLDLLADLVAGGTSVPGPVLVAVVHGELLALSPFDAANGVVARAAARLTMIGTGLDPKGLTVPEVFFLRRSDRYTEAAAGFRTGTDTALAEWLLLCCEAIEAGAREATSIADAALAG